MKENPMASLKDLYKSADWKQEKHVPVIDAPDSVIKGDVTKVTVTVGKDLSHPNTTEHHIRWIDVYFQPDGESTPIQVGRAEFTAHGESAKGPNTGAVYTHHEVTLGFKTDKPGTLFAASYCNIHGLWESAKKINLG
jgi:superoxide reductase